MAAFTTIDDPEKYFQTQLYTGNGSANNAITLGGGTNMQPDLVWIKNRDATDSHCLFDAVRGATKVLHSDATTAEVTDTDTLDSFTSDGFQVDADVKVNTNTEKYVAWCWKETADAGFDIVSYAGNTTNRTIAHGLSAVPHFIIVKNREAADPWRIYSHRNSVFVISGTGDPETDYLVLDTTAASVDDATAWNDTAPTSSVFSVGESHETNGPSENMIAYLWTEKQGFSKFGRYFGTGNVDGIFVWTGFRPAFVLVKSMASTSAWQLFDDQREGFNVDNDSLNVDDNSVESTTNYIDLLSNGFKIVIAGDPNITETFIYAAFAKTPFVNSKGVPGNAR